MGVEEGAVELRSMPTLAAKSAVKMGRSGLRVQREMQISFGNDKKKGNGGRRFPSGMTKERQWRTQIPYGNDKKGDTKKGD